MSTAVSTSEAFDAEARRRREAIIVNMRFFRTLLFLCPIAILLAQTPPPPPAPTVTLTAEKGPELPVVPPDKVIITVGDTKITAAQFNQIIDALPPQFQTNARGAGRTQYAENLVKILVLAEEARRRKLDEAPAYKIQSLFQNSTLLANRAYEQLNQETKPSEADLRKYYDAHQSEFEQVKARHILIRMQGSSVPVRPGQKDLSEEEALAKVQEVRKKIVAGQEFATIASQESDDTGSGSLGGDLGTIRHNQMVPAFDEALFKLKPGEMSEPVKTQFGYHLIKLDSLVGFTFEDAKPELERKLKPQMSQKALEDL